MDYFMFTPQRETRFIIYSTGNDGYGVTIWKTKQRPGALTLSNKRDTSGEGARAATCSRQGGVKMARLRRANTWEISDSERESGSELVAAVRGSASGDGMVSFLGGGTAGPSPAKKKRRRQMEADTGGTREERRRERARIEEEKRREKQRRREAAERVRSYRPEACLRSFTVCVDPALVQNEEIDLLLGTLSSLEWKSAIEEQHLTHSITWRRALPEGELMSVIQEEQVLMVLTLSEFLEMLTSIQKVQQSKTLEEVTCGSLFKELSEYLNRNMEKVVTLAVIGLSSWDLWRQQRRDKVATSKWDMGMDEALVFLQLYKNVCVMFLESWQDLTDHVCAITKALSKRPMKRLTEEPSLPFCVEGSWASGVRVGKDGCGLQQVWSRQVQQLNRVSRSVAVAVTTAFPSPQMLLQAYKDSHSEAERKGLLADLPVKSDERERRVGPEISSRLYRLLTSYNPQLVLD